MKKHITSILITTFFMAFIIFLSGCNTTVTGQEIYNPEVNPGNFVKDINNKYFTLVSGKTYIYEGETEEGAEHIEVSTLDEIKIVMGVECRVVLDRVWLDDQLVEETRDFYAQDKDGNVWYFGEESQTLENGIVASTEGSWEAGVDDAKPGIIMLADPEVGTEYRQEYYKGEAEDMGKIEDLKETVETPYGKFVDCLKTRDWTPLEIKVDEYKYYSPEIGNLVKEEGIYSKEVINLVDIKTE